MDINNLFNTTKDTSTTVAEEKSFNLSLVSYLNTKPLIYGLEKNTINHHFNLFRDVPAVCAQKLHDGAADMGILPSIEYARSKATLKIIPGLSIASERQVKSVALFFNKELKDIKRVAIDNSSRTSVALLKILLQECYEINPDYVEMEPIPEKMLASADAALLIGDKALHYQVENTNNLDLAEEWFDLTGLPFVFAFWAGHDIGIGEKEIDQITQSYEMGKQNIEEIAKEYAVHQPYDWKFYADYLTSNISYSLGEPEKTSILEFYRYAFFYGLTEYIPELNFYGE